MNKFQKEDKVINILLQEHEDGCLECRERAERGKLRCKEYARIMLEFYLKSHTSKQLDAILNVKAEL